MFKTNSLFARTFLLISVSMTIIMIFFSYLSIENKNRALLGVIYSKAKTIAKSIALVSSDAMVVEDYSFIVQHNKRVIEDNREIIYIVVTKNNSNTNIISSSNGWRVSEKIPNVLTDAQGNKESSKILRSELSNNKEIYHYTYPIIFSGVKWGWVSIGFSLEKYNNSLSEAYLSSLFLLLVTLVISFIFSFALTKWLLRPIILLKNAAKQVTSGDLKAKVDIVTNDEIGELAHSFNDMVETVKISNDKLYKSNEELENRVNQRTKELNELNISLDKRVKDELHKRLEQEQILIQQSRFAAMGEMIGNIAHQWRQPLNALGLLLQNIENAYEMEILDEAYIARVVEKGNRLTKTMSQTIDDFRNFFKPNKESVLFCISSSLKSTIEMIRSSFENSMITISQDIDESLSIKGFPSEFSQVLLNILNNAKDALIDNKIEDKKILIKIYKEDNYANIEISDNAGGIPEEILEHIFDPYFTTKEEGKGTGIGLYMSKTIIENNMKGSLSVKNSFDGAIFTLKVNAQINTKNSGVIDAN